MAYFQNKPAMVALVFYSFREWFSSLVGAIPFLLILLGFEWLFVQGSHAVLPFWGQMLYLLVGGVIYGLIAYSGLFAVHCRLLGDEPPFMEVCQRLRERFFPMCLVLLICALLICIVLSLILMFFASYSVGHAFHGLFRKPIIVALFGGGIIMVVSYVFFMWMPYVVIHRKTVFQSLLRSSTLSTGASWRQTALAFIVFVCLGLLLFGGNKVSHYMSAHHLTLLYNAACYATVGVWLATYVALLTDAHGDDDPFE